ncbi:hypothetical protein ID866_1755 [Astraeus odoratus]|nr:hypothetical protein ID866_1755 [Astraeus odoratus]
MSVTFLRYPATYHWRLFPCCRRSFSQAALAPSSTSVLQPHREPYASADTSPNCNAQQQGIQQSGKSIHDFIKVESHLASIRAAGLDPTLEDIEKFRPARHSRPDTRKYADQYCKLRDAICRAFSKDQLRRFTELYELDAMLSHPKRRKIEYAESIIEQQWGWPSLKEIERRRMDRTEVISKSFHLSPSELFLILGKGGL